jgi:ParB/RepB/Spo0J family partition protein
MSKQKQVQSPKSKVESSNTFEIDLDSYQPGQTLAIPIETWRIVPNNFEPQQRRRARFKQEDFESLGKSILKHGLRQPILVRPIAVLDERKADFEIVFGERRWEATKAAKISFVNCFVESLTDAQVIELQYEENHKRQDNDPLDDAFYFKYLQDNEGYSVKDLSIKFSISEKAVANKLKFNDLIDEAKQDLSEGFLPLGHALYLSKFSPETQQKILEDGLPYQWGDKNDGAQSFTEFKDEVEKEILRKLATAPFNPDDERLHLKGLVCSKCPERTGFSPMLFDGADNWENDSCLNAKCFSEKINVNLRIKREDIAAKICKPGVFIEDAVKKVPLVTESSYFDKDDIPFSDAKILTSQNLIESTECEHANPALCVKGDKKGQEVFICNTESCEVHNPISDNKTEKPTELSDWERRSKEKEFNSEVAKSVREEVFAESIKFFESGNSFWQYSDLVDELLAQFLFSRRHYWDELKTALKTFPKLPKNFDDSAKTKAFIAQLEPFHKSQLLFLCTYATDGYIGYNFTPQDGVEKIAKDYTKLNYKKLDAEMRMNLAPDEFKHLAEGYLLQVVSGVDDAEPPHFWYEENKDE